MNTLYCSDFVNQKQAIRKFQLTESAIYPYSCSTLYYKCILSCMSNIFLQLQLIFWKFNKWNSSCQRNCQKSRGLERPKLLHTQSFRKPCYHLPGVNGVTYTFDATLMPFIVANQHFSNSFVSLPLTNGKLYYHVIMIVTFD